MKHQQLLKEENDLKENLQIKVTKVKEKLEKSLSETNNKIKMIERINKGVNKMKNEEKNIIKNLSFVSNINKLHKKIKKSLFQLMTSVKFTYEEKEKNIKYEEYNFNECYIPKNIQFKNVYATSLEISWEVDKIENLESNKIKFIVEMRKEKENEKYEKVYEGLENKCSVKNLIQNSNYVFKIYSIFNNVHTNLIEEEFELKKIKTLNCDSYILMETNKGNEYLEKLLEWSGYKQMELLYRGTKDGMHCSNFHNKCDNKGETITLIKNDKGYIFGGFLSVSWKGGECYGSAPGSFLFTLTNIHNSEPKKFPSKNDGKEIYYSSNNGPLFGAGHDIGIYDYIANRGGWTNFPHTYEDTLGKGRTVFTEIWI